MVFSIDDGDVCNASREWIFGHYSGCSSRGLHQMKNVKSMAGQDIFIWIRLTFEKWEMSV
jgi:hypothetical protein